MIKQVKWVFIGLFLSSCAVANLVDEVATGGAVGRRISGEVNYERNLQSLMEQCINSPNTTTAFCEKMMDTFKRDRPSYEVIRSTMLCARKDGYDKFDACYAFAKRTAN